MRIKINKEVKKLICFLPLFEESESIEFFGEFEISPFNEFNAEFGNCYWYLKYMLLKNQCIEVKTSEIDKEYFDLFSESKINFEWVSIRAKEKYELKCIDGSWYVLTEIPRLKAIVEKIK